MVLESPQRYRNCKMEGQTKKVFCTYQGANASGTDLSSTPPPPDGVAVDVLVGAELGAGLGAGAGAGAGVPPLPHFFAGAGSGAPPPPLFAAAAARLAAMIAANPPPWATQRVRRVCVTSSVKRERKCSPFQQAQEREQAQERGLKPSSSGRRLPQSQPSNHLHPHHRPHHLLHLRHLLPHHLHLDHWQQQALTYRPFALSSTLFQPDEIQSTNKFLPRKELNLNLGQQTSSSSATSAAAAKRIRSS